MCFCSRFVSWCITVTTIQAVLLCVCWGEPLTFPSINGKRLVSVLILVVLITQRLRVLFWILLTHYCFIYSFYWCSFASFCLRLFLIPVLLLPRNMLDDFRLLKVPFSVSLQSPWTWTCAYCIKFVCLEFGFLSLCLSCFLSYFDSPRALCKLSFPCLIISDFVMQSSKQRTQTNSSGRPSLLLAQSSKPWRRRSVIERGQDCW